MLTQEQKVVIKTSILADPTQANNATIGDYSAIADWLNSVTSFVVWKKMLTSTEARSAIISGDQLSQLDNLTVGKRDALLYALRESIDISNVDVRTAIQGLCGTQNILKTALTNIMKRLATKAESILATGTGSVASPGDLTFEGTISAYDIGGILSA